MKLLIAGSRSIDDVEFVKRCYLNSKLDSDVSEIVSGGATGVDTIAELIAKERSKKFKLFPANWDVYGKKAGFIRNMEMVNYCDTALLIWDGESKGTNSTIELLSKEKKPFILYKKGLLIYNANVQIS